MGVWTPNSVCCCFVPPIVQIYPNEKFIRALCLHYYVMNLDPYLRLLHTWSIISTKIDGAIVVGRFFIPFIQVEKGIHPPVLRPRSH